MLDDVVGESTRSSRLLRGRDWSQVAALVRALLDAAAADHGTTLASTDLGACVRALRVLKA
jgi:hypothetical protein